MRSRSGMSPLAMVGLLLGCVAMAAALTVVGQPPAAEPVLGQPPAPAASNGTVPAPASGPPTRAPFVLPSYDRPLTDDERLQVMLDILLASIPPEYALPDSPIVNRTVGGRPRWVEVQGTRIEEVPGGIRYTASTEAYLGNPYGLGAATITLGMLAGDGAMPVVDNPCSVPGPPEPDTDIVCTVVTTATGLRVRFATTYGWRYVSAAVAYPGLTIFAVQEPSSTARSTDVPILDREAMVALVTTPALKQL